MTTIIVLFLTSTVSAVAGFFAGVKHAEKIRAVKEALKR